MVRGTWVRGHHKRGENGGLTVVTPLTDDEIESADEYTDLGMIDLPESDEGIPAGGGPPPSTPTGPPPEQPDEPPAHARKRKRGPAAEPVRRIRITAGIRADINAKVSMPLEIGGQIWAARDGLCGGTFLTQRPHIADALTDIICDSPALVAWFTGPVGGFMMYLNLAAALWPVLEMLAAHHVYHSVEAAPDSADRPQPAYAA